MTLSDMLDNKLHCHLILEEHSEVKKYFRSFFLKLFTCCLLLAAAGFSEAKEMNFTLTHGAVECESCGLIIASGPITTNTPRAFKRFVNKSISSDKKYTVVMHSPGGSLSGGLKFGRLIRSYGMNTHIAQVREGKNSSNLHLDSGLCASSCAFAFLGGDNRSMHQKSLYGLHQISIRSNALVPINEAVKGTQSVISEITGYVEEMGVNPKVVTSALKTEAQHIDWVQNQSLTMWKVVNSGSLFLQEDWEYDQSARAWRNHSILSDGTISLNMLLCPSSLRSKNFNLIVLPYYKLSKTNPFYNGFIDVQISVGILGSSSQHRDKVTIYYGGGEGSIRTEMPVRLLKSALSSKKPIEVVADYPRPVAKAYKIKNYGVPYQGLNDLLAEARYICPQLF